MEMGKVFLKKVVQYIRILCLNSHASNFILRLQKHSLCIQEHRSVCFSVSKRGFFYVRTRSLRTVMSIHLLEQEM